MTTGAIRVPTALKVGLAIAVLLVVNQFAPGIPGAMLALVALYLLLRHSDQIASLLAGAVSDLDRTLGSAQGYASPAPALGRQPI